MRSLFALAATAALILPGSAASAASVFHHVPVTFGVLVAAAHSQSGAIDVLPVDLSAKHGGTGIPVTHVPEPATWALMVLGLGSVGFAMRRRRGSISFG